MNKTSRRRSLSASRTFDSTVNFVGRIGASLRISSRKRAKEIQKLEQATSFKDTNSESWLCSGAHYAKVGVERRRSTCSAIFLGANKIVPKLYFADEDCEELDEVKKDKKKNNKHLETHYQKRYQVSSQDCRLLLYNSKEKSQIATDCYGIPTSKSNISLVADSFANLTDNEDDFPPQTNYEYNNENKNEKCLDSEDDAELLSLALIPLFSSSSVALCSTNNKVSSPMTVNSLTDSNENALTFTQSCPSTPQMPRRRYMREGATQLTSLTTLCTHHRYLFLFNDLLLVSKQKGENSYKLKEKVSLDCLWISSNNCAYSFLIGWPIQNFTAHFSSETERNEWFNKLSNCIQRRISVRPKTTTISVAVRIEGRHQLIRRDIENGAQASQIVQELICTLDLPALDQNLFHYELCFESGPFNNNAITASITGSGLNGNNTSTINSSVSNFHSNPGNLTSYSGSGNIQLSPLNGVENVYAILMNHAINRTGASLSDSQLAHLDTCPLVNCRLVLRQTTNNGSASSGHSRSSTALHIVNQFRKVLSRTESSSKKLFGRQLEGSMPPQPVLTMIDHLTIYGAEVEGIFRKSPKQATVRVLKSQLDQGQVPDFHQFNVHVTASLLKEYLRSIPGQLLISGNYHLWMEINDEYNAEKKLKACRQLLRLLPPSHTVLLRSILRLLRRISNAELTSKMGISALAVCIAPSLLDNSNIVDCARRVPDLAVYLIQNANELFDNFVDDTLLVPTLPNYSSKSVSASASTTGSDEGCGSETHQLHQSTDSGLSDDATAGTSHSRHEEPKSVLNLSTSSISAVNYENRRAQSVSPDSALFEIPASECSGDDERYFSNQTRCEGQKRKEAKCSENGIQIKEINCSILPDQSTLKHQICGVEVVDEEEERTPVLSRENSDVKTQFPNRYQWRSHLSSNVAFLKETLGSDAKSVLHSSDLSVSGDGVRVLRLKPRSASPCASPNFSLASSVGDQFCRFYPTTLNAPKVAPNLVSNVDDLRVSDFIISSSCLKSNNESNEIEGLYSPIIALCERSSRKTSTVSMDSELRRINSRKISTASVESGASQAATPSLHRTSLVTKNESLGLPAARNSSVVPNYIEKSTRKSAFDRFACNKSPTISALLPSNEPQQRIAKCTKKPTVMVNNAIPNLKRSNSTSMNACIAAAKVQQQKQQRQASERAVGNAAPLLTSQLPANNSAVSWNQSANRSAEESSSTIGAKIVRRQSDRRNNVVPPCTTTFGAGSITRNLPNGQHRQSVGAKITKQTLRPSISQPGYKPWRPPKRTAEEIVLDKSLEVNWSVSSIRSVFQKHKDDKPTSIDTVYAKFNATKKSSTPAD